MLDPFGTKSRANPEKMGRNGPFWMLTQDEFWAQFASNFRRKSHESNTCSTGYLSHFSMCDSGFGTGLDPPRSLHESAE
jgi:hypothetical protein